VTESDAEPAEIASQPKRPSRNLDPHRLVAAADFVLEFHLRLVFRIRDNRLRRQEVELRIQDISFRLSVNRSF
jgi:hypothetical protein